MRTMLIDFISTKAAVFTQHLADLLDLDQGNERGLSFRFDVLDCTRADPVVDRHETHAEEVGCHRLGNRAVERDLPGVPFALDLAGDRDPWEEARPVPLDCDGRTRISHM